MISFTTEDFTAGRRRRSVEQLPQQLSAALAVPGARCPSLAELAQGLCVSTRTLKRRLQARGLSYRRLLDQARLGRAAELLQQSRRPLEAIAAELGYSSSANFSRAFRRWAGVTPGRYRQQGAAAISTAAGGLSAFAAAPAG